MRKILSFLVLLLNVGLLGCASKGQVDAAGQSSVFEELPFVYKMTVQQGNIINEEMVDSLQPGMNKRQVRFLLGTPLLVDLFHPGRWDYTYTIRRGHQPMEAKRLTLFFEDDALVRIEGDIRPGAAGAEEDDAPLIVKVPDWEDRRGLFRQAAEVLGLDPAE